MMSEDLPTMGAMAAAAVQALAAAMALAAAVRRRRGPATAVAWCAIAATLVLLAVLRLLDVEEHWARSLATRAANAGWYDDRRRVQRLASFAALALGGGGAALALVAARRSGVSLAAAVVATAALVTLALLRTISLHSVDRWLHTGIGLVTVSRLIEAGSLAILLAAAALSIVTNRRRRRR